MAKMNSKKEMASNCASVIMGVQIKRENQRWYIGKNWCNEMVPLADPKSFVVETHVCQSQTRFLRINNHSNHLVLLSSWQLLHNDESDENAWHYGNNFQSLKHPNTLTLLQNGNASFVANAGAFARKPDILDYVRTRVWVKRVEIEVFFESHSMAVFLGSPIYPDCSENIKPLHIVQEDVDDIDPMIDALSPGDENNGDDDEAPYTSEVGGLSFVSSFELVNKTQSHVFLAAFERTEGRVLSVEAADLGIESISLWCRSSFAQSFCLAYGGKQRVALALPGCASSDGASRDTVCVLAASSEDGLEPFFCSTELSSERGSVVLIDRTSVSVNARCYLITASSTSCSLPLSIPKSNGISSGQEAMTAELNLASHKPPLSLASSLSMCDALEAVDTNAFAPAKIIPYSKSDIQILSAWKWRLHKHTSVWVQQRDRLRKQAPVFQHAHDVAEVTRPRLDSLDHKLPLGVDEVAYIHERLPFCREALRRYLQPVITLSNAHVDIGVDVDDTNGFNVDDFIDSDLPTLAVCYSGGGCRALIASIGCLRGLSDLGLSDTLLYSAGLSGGAWFQTLWVHRDLSNIAVCNTVNSPIETKSLPNANETDDQFVADLRMGLSADPFLIGPMRSKWLLESLLGSCAHRPNNELALSDFYGALLALQWLRPDKPRSATILTETLSQQAKWLRVDPHRQPLPIYSAVQPGSEFAGGYEWCEFTPWEFRYLSQQVSIPVWSFGREFHAGHSVSVSPEIPLGCLMGLWGSAFSASIAEVMRNVGHRSPALSVLLNALPAASSHHRLVAPPVHFNPASGLEVVSGAQVCVPMVDAGVCCNAPLPPLLVAARAVDVIFISDARPTDFDQHDSKDVLRRLELWASAHGLRMPPIAYDNVGIRPCTVFMDPSDVEVPTLVYLPCVANSEYSVDFDPANAAWADFAEFKYTPEHFDVLSGLTRHNVGDSASAIRRTLQLVAMKKRHARLEREKLTGTASDQ